MLEVDEGKIIFFLILKNCSFFSGCFVDPFFLVSYPMVIFGVLMFSGIRMFAFAVLYSLVSLRQDRPWGLPLGLQKLP